MRLSVLFGPLPQDAAFLAHPVHKCARESVLNSLLSKCARRMGFFLFIRRP